MIDESRINEMASDNNSIIEKFNNYFANSGNSFDGKFLDSYIFEDCVGSANVNEPLRCLTVSLGFLETILSSLRNLSPEHDENYISILKELFFSLLLFIL